MTTSNAHFFFHHLWRTHLETPLLCFPVRCWNMWRLCLQHPGDSPGRQSRSQRLCSAAPHGWKVFADQNIFMNIITLLELFPLLLLPQNPFLPSIREHLKYTYGLSPDLGRAYDKPWGRILSFLKKSQFQSDYLAISK